MKKIILPEMGKIYIFSTMVSLKGEFCSSGKNSSVLLEDDTKDNNLADKETYAISSNIQTLLENNETYSAFLQACENQTAVERKRFAWNGSVE